MEADNEIPVCTEAPSQARRSATITCIIQNMSVAHSDYMDKMHDIALALVEDKHASTEPVVCHTTLKSVKDLDV